jgi:predicted dehydrogenase
VEDWRRFWEFGNGTLGDIGCHFMDLPVWALDLDLPTSVKVQGDPIDPVFCPEKLTVYYEFGDLKLTWHQGCDKPSAFPVDRQGMVFLGREGKLWTDPGIIYHDGIRRLFPEDKDFDIPPKTLPDSVGHMEEWLQACKTGSLTTCNFEYAAKLTEIVLLGHEAHRGGE